MTDLGRDALMKWGSSHSTASQGKSTRIPPSAASGRTLIRLSRLAVLEVSSATSASR